MPIQYVIPITLTVVGDGQSQGIVFDLLNDYAYLGEGYRTGWLTGKHPVSASPVQTSAIGYDVAISGGTKLLITFPSPPPKNVQVPVSIHLYFNSEDVADKEPDPDGAHREVESWNISGQ